MDWNPFRTKFNPSQPEIGDTTESSKEPVYTYTRYYEDIEIVNRGCNMIIDDASEIPTSVGKQAPGTAVHKGMKKVTLDRLLNHEPNPFQDINTFRRNLITDYLLDGNIFIYFDGTHMYHLPANKVTIKSSKKFYIDHYEYSGTTVPYLPKEIIHIKENSFDSIFRGTSRLKPATRTMALMSSMRNFQDNFFKNGAVPGLIIKTPNTLSEKIKVRLIESWMNKYRPDTGGRRPLVLDGGLELDTISDINFRDLDFQASIAVNENIILKSLGVPPILLDSGNNANLRPNLRMYYLETVLPIIAKLNFGLERYFGYIVKEDITDIPALQPELRDQSAYYASLVNGGILTPNEAREALGKEEDKDPESDKLRIPANIAGSAANPDEGGKPPEEED
jgi:HK97 family phage portal protein